MYSAIFLAASLASYGLANPILPIPGFGGSAGAGADGNGGLDISGLAGGVTERLPPIPGLPTGARPTGIIRPLPTGIINPLPTGIIKPLTTGIIIGPIAGVPTHTPIRPLAATTDGPIRDLSVGGGTTPQIQETTDAIGGLAGTLNTVRELLNELLNATDVDEILRLANLAKAAITAGSGAQVTLGAGAGAGFGKREEAIDESTPQDVLQAILNGILEIIANPDPATIQAKVQDLIDALNSTVLPAVGQLIADALARVLGLAGSALNTLGGGGLGNVGHIAGGAGGLGNLGNLGGGASGLGNLGGGLGGTGI